MVERTVSFVDLFILGKHEFFCHFTVKKTRLTLLAGKLSCLYIQWSAYKYAICVEGLRKKCALLSKSLVYRGEIKGSEILLMSILSEKNDPPREHYTNFLLVTRKCCYLLGKSRKHI